MAPTIDYEELKFAMTQGDPYGELRHYLDTETGEVFLSSDWTKSEARALDDPDKTDQPDVRLAWYLLWFDGDLNPDVTEERAAELDEEAQARWDRILEVPGIPTYEAYEDMVDFAATVNDRHLRELPEVALDGRGAFRRFKDVLLRYPKERERWFTFRDRRLVERMNRWLRLHELPEYRPGEPRV